MQITLPITLLLATATAAVLPRIPSVQVQFANDVTGANGNALIPLNNVPVSLGVAYAATNLEKEGTLFVTSLQFTGNFQNVACEVLRNGNTIVASIQDPVRDFQRFSEKPLNWQTGFAISCFEV